MKKGWQTKALGEICNVVGGGTPPKDKPEFYSGNIPWATVRDMKQDVITETEFKITKDAVKTSSTNIIPSGNVVIATRVGLGKVCLLGQDTAINQDLRGIIPLNSQTLNVRYLYWWFKTISDAIIAEGTGATVQGVKLPFIKSLQIPVPPLAEQKRIVAKLDEAFAGLAKAKENAERNLQNARALFESHLDEVFMRSGEDMNVRKLEDVCVIGDGNHSSNYPKKHELAEEGVPFIRATNLVGGEISDEDMRFLSPKKHAQLKKGHLKTGDILFTNRGEIGKTAVVDSSHDGSNLNSQVAWLRCGETLNNLFLFYYLNSGKIKAHLETAKNGAALQQFTIKQIKELKIPIPPKHHQIETVQSLDGLSKKTKHLKRLYEQKSEALESLKKSILHEAFSGNL